jgi:ribonucleoside-diphosphate reductase alpha chain
MSSSVIPPPRAASPFIDASAVEAWDAWFRWRCNGELRDLTVEASWERVAGALATAETSDAAGWKQRFRDGLAGWKVLPDACVLRCAGTELVECPPTGLGAALNLAGFVRGAFTGWAGFDRDGFRAGAELAVRMLDDAITLTGAELAEPPRLRIGFIGLADALALLGVRYASPEGMDYAREFARLLAEGTLAGSVQLAAERGARLPFDAAQQARAEARGMPPALIEAAGRHGLRHAALTAIDSQPRLALLANNVADALDPLPAESSWLVIDAPGGSRRLRSYGFAHNLRRRHLVATGGQCAALENGADCSIVDQILLRAELAPWIDAPIDYPYPAADAPDPVIEADWVALATSRSLPTPTWRRVDGDD